MSKILNEYRARQLLMKMEQLNNNINHALILVIDKPEQKLQKPNYKNYNNDTGNTRQKSA